VAAGPGGDVEHVRYFAGMVADVEGRVPGELGWHRVDGGTDRHGHDMRVEAGPELAGALEIGEQLLERGHPGRPGGSRGDATGHPECDYGCQAVPPTLVGVPVPDRVPHRQPPAGLAGGTKTAEPREKHRVVIVGAGFAGFNAARELSKLVGTTTEIVVINSTDYFLYLPLMPQVSGGLIEPAHVRISLPRRLRKTRFVLGTVNHVDSQQKVVSWEGPEDTAGQVRYDRLILTAGA
jgi:hypothetical protein